LFKKYSLKFFSCEAAQDNEVSEEIMVADNFISFNHETIF